MRVSIEEPTGMRVRDEAGREVRLTFPTFVAAIEQGVILPDDYVCSHLVTRDRWVRAGDMRLYRLLRQEERMLEERKLSALGGSPVFLDTDETGT